MSHSLPQQLEPTLVRTHRALVRSTSPRTGRPLGHVPLLRDDEIRSTVARARDAQRQWSEVPLRERRARLRPLQDYLANHQDRFARLLSLEVGMTRQDALRAEVLPTLHALGALHDMTGKWRHEGSVHRNWLAARFSTEHRRPLGVCAFVPCPSTPFFLPTVRTLLALLAGNAVVVKPSRRASLVGESLSELLQIARLPDGLFQLVTGPGRALLDAGLELVHFTGSSGAARRLSAAAAETLTPVMIDVAGKSPMIVLADADLDAAADAAVWGAFHRAGQTLGATERVYVHHDVAPAFEARVAKRTHELLGGPTRDAELPAVCTPSDLVRIRHQLDDAVSRGGRILAGGHRPPGAGLVFEPTVVAGVNHECICMTENTYGPLLPIMRFQDDERAIALANALPRVRRASLWSRNQRRSKMLARGLNAPAVSLNDATVVPALPSIVGGDPIHAQRLEQAIGLGLHDVTALQRIQWTPTRRQFRWWWKSDSQRDRWAELAEALANSRQTRTRALLRLGVRFRPRGRRSHRE